MTEHVRSKADIIKGINDLALHGEIVIFGSTYMANFPFYELINKCELEHAIYNRSIEGLTLAQAGDILEDCVLSIHPSKVFLAFGEEDAGNPSALTEYQSIVERIRTALPACKVYLILLPLQGEGAQFNEALRGLCDGKHVMGIPFAPSPLSDTALYRSRFKELCRFFRSKPIGLAEAFAVAEL